MKKCLYLLVIMLLMVIPTVAKADIGFVFSDNECISQSNGTETTKTCFLRVQSDEYINEIEGLLVYPNHVTLSKVSTYDSWTSQSTGDSKSLHFVSSSKRTGNYYVAALTFTIKGYTKDCKIVFSPTKFTRVEDPKYTCQNVNGQYWGKNSTVVDEETYQKECLGGPFTCSKVGNLYWGKNSTVVDEATYISECTTPAPVVSYTCAIVDGQYWGKNSVVVDEATYTAECTTPAPVVTYSCAIVNGQYWGKNNVVVDQATYTSECTTPTPVVKKQEPVSNPDTGAFDGFYIVGAGVAALFGIRFLKNKQDIL